MLMEIQPEPILFIKTFDRHTGELKIHPVYYRHYGEQYVVVAYNETGTYKPEWYMNLKEEPIVEIEVEGSDKFAVASTPVGAARIEILSLVEQLSHDVRKGMPRNITGVLLTPME